MYKETYLGSTHIKPVPYDLPTKPCILMEIILVEIGKFQGGGIKYPQSLSISLNSFQI